MVIELTTEQEARLREAARQDGRAVDELLTEAALWVSAHQALNEASAQRGFDQLDRGEYVGEDEMDARFARMLNN